MNFDSDWPVHAKHSHIYCTAVSLKGEKNVTSRILLDFDLRRMPISMATPLKLCDKIYRRFFSSVHPTSTIYCLLIVSD